MLSHNRLPEDLIKDIILKLPVKSLLRFKCVAKSWDTLITDPSFITEHLEWSKSITKNNRLKLIFCVDSLMRLPPRITLISKDQPYYCEPHHISALPHKYHWNLYGVCNGIFCLYVINFNEETDILNSDGNIILWNPTIKEIKVIPVPQFIISPKAMSSALYGFGFDYTTKDYKVVRVSDRPLLEGERVAQVYNLSTNSWRTIDVVVPVPKFEIPVQKFGCFLHGVYYWYVHAFSVIQKDFILSFDFSTELFGMIKLPLIGFHSFFGGKVFVLDGCLAVLEHNLKTHESNIWVKNGTPSWANKFEIRRVPKFKSVLGSWGDNEILIEEQGHQKDHGQLISYNLQNHHIHRFEAHSGGIYGFDYVESLVPLVERRKHFTIGSR